MKAEGLSKRLKKYRKILGFTPDELEGVIRHAEALENELKRTEFKLKDNFTKSEIIDILKDCEHMDDAVMYFYNLKN